MDLLIYSLSPLSKEEGVGNVALNSAERLHFTKTFYSPGKHRKALFYSFLSPIVFALAVRKIKPKVVLVHTTEACFDPIVARALFGFKYKVVCVAHGLYADLMKEYKEEVRLGNAKKKLPFLLNMKISSFRSRFVSKADAVISVSNMVKKDLARRYRVSSVVIPNGFDEKDFLGKTQRSSFANKNTLLFAGNQYWLKGLHYLIRANNSIATPWKIVVAGLDKAQEEELRHREDCKNVEFKGKPPRKEYLSLHKKADAFALPSVYESFGITCLDALAFGLPVIASKGTGTEDLVKDGVNGLLVEKRDEKGLAIALKKIREMKTGKVTLDKKFFWKNVALEYEKVLKSAGLKAKK